MAASYDLQVLIWSRVCPEGLYILGRPTTSMSQLRRALLKESRSCTLRVHCTSAQISRVYAVRQSIIEDSRCCIMRRARLCGCCAPSPRSSSVLKTTTFCRSAVSPREAKRDTTHVEACLASTVSDRQFGIDVPSSIVRRQAQDGFTTVLRATLDDIDDHLSDVLRCGSGIAAISIVSLPTPISRSKSSPGAQ